MISCLDYCAVSILILIISDGKQRVIARRVTVVSVFALSTGCCISINKKF